MPAFRPFTLSPSHITFLSWGSLLRQAASFEILARIFLKSTVNLKGKWDL